MTKAHGFQVQRAILNLLLLVRRYKINLHWFLTGEGTSGLEADMSPIKLLDQQAAAGRVQEVGDYPEK